MTSNVLTNMYTVAVGVDIFFYFLRLLLVLIAPTLLLLLLLFSLTPVYFRLQVKIQQDTGSPTLWGDACCVMLSGTMDNVVQAQQMILERIANISDRLKDMVSSVLRASSYLLLFFYPTPSCPSRPPFPASSSLCVLFVSSSPHVVVDEAKFSLVLPLRIPVEALLIIEDSVR